jgi:antitoxin (DNA-binding transcriptional repressor) of toxin-antitoxin stability system
MVVTASRLRENVYKILDSVIETGEPVEIERKGRVLRIVADRPGKTPQIRKRPGLINGNPRDLANIDWSKEWNPDGNS